MSDSPAAKAAVPLNEQTKGIAFVCAGVFIFTLQDVAIKWMSGTYPVHQIVFFRSLVAIVLVTAIVHFDGGLSRLRTKRSGLHLVRSVLMFVSYTSYYLSIAVLPLADAISLAFSAPLFITALSVPFLGERVGLRRWVAVLVGFLGVVVMVRPGFGVFEPAALLALLCALAYAVGQMIARRLGVTDSGSVMAFYATVLYLVASGVIGLAIGNGALDEGGHPSIAFLVRAWSWPVPFDLALMASIGVVAAFGFYFLSQAYRVAEPTAVAPFEYSGLPWVVLWGYLIFGNIPSLHTVVGIVLVVGAGFYVLHRESKTGRVVAARKGLFRPR